MAVNERVSSPASGISPIPFDIIALVTSAGGLEALGTVLRDLPPGLPAAVLVVQHLGGQGSTLVDILERRARMPVQWIEDGDPITPGRVQICPPRKFLEVLPDITCALTPLERVAREKPIDFFLKSLADSIGARALVVVLTGMGKDGAVGARAVKQASGTVLAQSEDTAEQPSMPRAAVEIGAVDLVLPLHHIGQVLADVMSGGRFPRPHDEIAAAQALFIGPGEVPQLMREIDWARTPLGPIGKWPHSLRTTLKVVLESSIPMIVLWGPDHVQLYNDHYRMLMGSKHPAGLGQPNRVCWPEVWDFNEPIFARVFKGESVAVEDALTPLVRRGSPENAWFNLAFTPVRNESGGAVLGVLATLHETTSRVLAERRMRTLHALATESSGAATIHAALQRALASLAVNDEDIPFALSYLLDNKSSLASLTMTVGLELGSPAAPLTIDLQGGNPAWPLTQVVHGGPTVLDDLAARFRGLHAGPWPQSPTSAFLLPLRLAGQEAVTGVFIAGIAPRLMFDASYRSFLELIAAQIEASLAQAGAREKERERTERLAELDRAKTEFFSNVSHEFRTPLTLLLAPLEELLHRRAELPGALAGEIEIAARNARRLLTLVASLLDFSQIEAGRLRARFEPSDLAALTADIVGVFRSAAERAGLRLRVDCPPLPEAVWVDREMWEKIISNLLSNALKSTFQGEIAVEMRALPQHAELVVRDTGVGIPSQELPHLFKRFHRVRGRRARTYEGAGIGLALVHELVRLHQGRVRVQSQEGEGTAFTVWIPLGPRPTIEYSSALETLPGQPAVAKSLAEEAAHWTQTDAALPAEVMDDPFGPTLLARVPGAHVLVVDDNADMRSYLRRLLAQHWQVEMASNGEAALERAQHTRPDLILADVMMPHLDGFDLLRRVRQDERLKHTPVILVTARAGEEAAIEGLLAGADDYLAKPFSARELVARVGGQLEMARVRRESQAQLAAAYQRTAETLESITEVFYAVDSGWRLTYLNNRAEEVWRRSRQDLLGTVLWDLFPGYEQTREYREHVRALQERTPVHAEFFSPHLSTWAEVHIYPSADGGLSVYANDITERKRTEEALRESRKELADEVSALARLHEASTHLWQIADLRSGLEEILDATILLLGADMGNVQLLNPATGMLEIVVQHGFQPDFLEFFREVSTEHDSACGRSLRTGTRVVIEDVETDAAYAPFRKVAAAAGYRAVQSTLLHGWDGEPLGMLSTHFRNPHRPSEQALRRLDLYVRQAADFIERQRKDTALRISEEQLRIATRGARIATFQIDIATGKTTFDDNAAEVYGASTEADPQSHDWMARVRTYLAPEDAHRQQAMMSATMRGEGDLHDELRMKDPATGQTTWIEAYATLVRDRDGRPSRVVGIMRNITERKKAEQELRRTDERVQATRRHPGVQSHPG